MRLLVPALPALAALTGCSAEPEPEPQAVEQPAPGSPGQPLARA